MPCGSSTKKKDLSVVETGRAFKPAMFEAVLKNFTPDVPNSISGRPRFVFFLDNLISHSIYHLVICR